MAITSIACLTTSFEFQRFAPDLVLGDGENLPLGRLEKLLRGELIRIAVANDLGGTLDQLPVGCLLLDDLGIVFAVGRVGNAGHDLGQCVVATDLLELSPKLQLFGERDRVDPLVLVVELADRRINDLVRIAIKVFSAEEDDDVVNDFIVEQYAAEYPALGFEMLGGRRSPSEPDSAHGTARPEPLALPLPGGRNEDDIHAKLPGRWLRPVHTIRERGSTDRSASTPARGPHGPSTDHSPPDARSIRILHRLILPQSDRDGGRGSRN